MYLYTEKMVLLKHLKI